MFLIIDGYNLLNASGVLAPSSGTLEGARQALLDFLVETLDAQQAARTTVVFDAGEEAPRHLPKAYTYQGLTIHFSRDYDDADAMIEELIDQNTAPRNLTVVSSDHRLQRAARRRRAKAVDSDRWVAEIVRRRPARPASPREGGKPSTAPTAGEVDYWVKKFSGTDAADLDRDMQGPFPDNIADDLFDEE